MYYPQDVTANMRTTGVTPGSQYFSSPESLAGHKEWGATGEAGTTILVNYDVWNRALFNHSGRNRYMLQVPVLPCYRTHYPAWDSGEAEWQGRHPQVGSRIRWDPCGKPCGIGTGQTPFRHGDGSTGMLPCRICSEVQRLRAANTQGKRKVGFRGGRRPDSKVGVRCGRAAA